MRTSRRLVMLFHTRTPIFVPIGSTQPSRPRAFPAAVPRVDSCALYIGVDDGSWRTAMAAKLRRQGPRSHRADMVVGA